MPVAATRSAEWKAHWPVVLAAMVGFSFTSISSYSTGLFMEPLQREFGWSRTLISAGLAIGALCAVLLSVPAGLLIDRWGTRRLAIPGLFLASCCFAMFSLADGSTVQWMALWVVYAIVELSIKSTVWTTAVSGIFNAGRSMAIATALSGAAVAQMLAPPLTNWLIVTYGWRMAYFWLGAGWGGIALILAVIFLFDSHDHARRAIKHRNAPPPVSLAGLTLGQALRNPVLLRIGAATLITMLLSVALIVHQVPILTEAGVTRANAAYLASLTGLASIIGKLMTGWLMERRWAGWVGPITLSISAIAFVMLLEPFRTPVLIVIAILIIGYTAGTKIHICAYLTSRYAGMRNFGAIFGVMSSLVALGSGLGPVIAGLIYDRTGSYTPLMVAGIPASLLSGLLIFGLGRYPDWSLGEAPATDAGPQPIPRAEVAQGAR